MAGWYSAPGCYGWQADGRIIAQRGDSFPAHVALALDGPFVVLLEELCADQASDGNVLGEGGTNPGRDDPPLGLAGIGQRVAHEVYPGAVEKLLRL